MRHNLQRFSRGLSCLFISPSPFLRNEHKIVPKFFWRKILEFVTVFLRSYSGYFAHSNKVPRESKTHFYLNFLGFWNLRNYLLHNFWKSPLTPEIPCVITYGNNTLRVKFSAFHVIVSPTLPEFSYFMQLGTLSDLM